MKISFQEVAHLPSSVRAILLEGENQGGARLAAIRFLSARAPRIRRFDIADFFSRPEHVEAALFAESSLFGQPDAVLISGLTGRYAPQASNLVKNARAPLAFVSAPLEPKSSLVQEFNTHHHLAHCPCPLLDLEGKGQLVDAVLGNHLSPEVRSHLQYILPEDSGAAQAALHTLQVFLNGRPPTPSLIDLLLDDQGSSHINDVIESVLDGQPARLPRALRRLPPGESRDIGLLRLFHWQVQRLHSVRAALDAGESLDRAIAHLRPPAFGHSKTVLVRRAKKWTTRGLENILTRLTEAEKQQKRGVHGPSATAYALLLLAQQGPH